MSTKLFWQIVLLMIIALFLYCAVKFAMFKCPIMGKKHCPVSMQQAK